MADFYEEIEKLQAENLKNLESEISSNSVRPAAEDSVLQRYSERLTELRQNGVNKITELRQEIVAAKKNRMLDEDARKKYIADSQKEIEAAKSVAAANKAEESKLTSKAVSYANIISKAYVSQVDAQQNERIVQKKAAYVQRKAEIKAEADARIAKLSSKDEIDVAKYELKSKLFDAKNQFQQEISRCKNEKNQAFVDHVMFNRSLRNGKTNALENIELSWRNYVTNFKTTQFLLNNGLYLAILLFFIICVIVAPLTGNGRLLSLPNILTILEQSSTRMFYALGVAGLILIAGTDLSICRMVALGAVTTGLILHPTKNIVSFFGIEPWDFTGLPMGGRLAMALGLAICLCVAFSCFSGFFTAKFKIHPFISTLSSQLIIYGLLFFGTSGTPVGSIDSNIKDLIGGRWVLGYVGGDLITFPKLIIPAFCAVFVAWFIWNKTTFGKNMYAVGGNAEAAAVSGINVFAVTMGIFIMAGIFYGCGSFLEAFRANASAGTGQGFELDAIAACVVGGISFNGGIGKVSGAVFGVFIFTGLTYCLTFLGIDTNLQFVFKGFILIAAVARDSVKYLKRK